MGTLIAPPVAELAPSTITPFRAVLVREFRASLLNRYVQVFSVLALGGGVAAVTIDEETGAAAFFLLQIQILPLRPAWHAFCSLIASMIASIGLPQPSLPISGHKPPTGEINGSW